MNEAKHYKTIFGGCASLLIVLFVSFAIWAAVPFKMTGIESDYGRLREKLKNERGKSIFMKTLPVKGEFHYLYCEPSFCPGMYVLSVSGKLDLEQMDNFLTTNKMEEGSHHDREVIKLPKEWSGPEQELALEGKVCHASKEGGRTQIKMTISKSTGDFYLSLVHNMRVSKEHGD